MPADDLVRLDPTALVTILAMALITYATRIGGLWLMRYVRPSPWMDAWVRHVPGAVLISIIAPAALTGGTATAIATGLTVLVAVRSRNLLLTIVAGVLAVWVLRNLF